MATQIILDSENSDWPPEEDQACECNPSGIMRQLAEEKEESLGMLMHDLKNHLVGMQMGANVLKDARELTADPGLSQIMENIACSSGQMLESVNQFLANAAASHRLVINLKAVSLSVAASHSVGRFQAAARQKELVVHASLPEDCTLVQADPNALNQVLDNLLSNAVKFSPAGKEILVVVRSASSYVECEVRDQGNGFTPEDKTRMFRRYELLSTLPTGGESCTGLGLSIVKKLMEAMRGELSCESGDGNGTSFSIRLPRAVG